MNGIRIGKTFLDFAKIEFKCPYCDKEYNDCNNVYLKRCDKNKSGTTKINCKCNNSFYMTYDYQSEAITFKHLK